MISQSMGLLLVSLAHLIAVSTTTEKSLTTLLNSGSNNSTMLRLIRSLFRGPEVAYNDDSDSFESQQEGLLEDELQRAGDFYAKSNRENDVAVYGSDQYDRTPSAAELAYYADYDPVIGYRIAVTLGILILLFIIFVLYKTHCHQQKNRRLTKNVTQQPQP